MPARRTGRPSAPPTPAPTGSSGRCSKRLASTSIGIRTKALTPPVSDCRSRTVMPCRPASRPTTYRPIIREIETSKTGGRASRSLDSAISCAVMPMPRSSISTIAPPSDSRWLCTSTFDSGEEKTVAFSSSSATRWTTWLTAWPITSTSGTPVSWIRWYCSTSEVAARSTSTSGIGRPHRRPASSPARTSRFSELRRMRVARWSSLKRLASWSGSCSPVSSSSISFSCRSTRPWLRRDRLTNIALTFERRAACSVASRTASRCSWSKVIATSPISSRESIGIGSTSIGVGRRVRPAQPFDRLRQPDLGDLPGAGLAAGAAGRSSSGR